MIVETKLKVTKDHESTKGYGKNLLRAIHKIYIPQDDTNAEYPHEYLYQNQVQ